MADLDSKIVISAVDRTRGPLRNVARGVRNVGKEAKQTGKELSKMDKHFDLASKLSLANVEVGRFAAKMRGALATPIQSAISFDDAMRRVTSRLSDASAQGNAALTALAGKLGKETRFTAEEAAAGMEALAVAGLGTKQIMETIPRALNLSAASGNDLGDTADILTNVMGGFRAEAARAGEFADVLTAGFTNSNTTLTTFGESMKIAAPAANALGISVQDTAALVGELGNAGIKGTNAGTALRTAMVKLVKPTQRTIKRLRKYGLTASDLAVKNGDFGATLDNIRDKTSKLGKEQRLAALAQIFGTEALSAMAVLMDREASPAFQKLTAAINEAEGATQKVAAAQEAGAGGGVRRYNSAMDGLKRTVGDKLLPVFTPLLEQLTNVVSVFSDFAEDNPALVRTLGVTAGAVAAMSTAAVPLITTVATLQTSMGLWALATQGVGTASAVATPKVAALGAVASKAFASITVFTAAYQAMTEFLKANRLDKGLELVGEDIFDYLSGTESAPRAVSGGLGADLVTDAPRKPPPLPPAPPKATLKVEVDDRRTTARVVESSGVDVEATAGGAL